MLYTDYMNIIQPQLIAIDLDDTLLKDDLTVSAHTVCVLQKVVQNNIYVVLASGRTDNAMLPYIRQLNIAGSRFGRYMICQNGAMILDLHVRLPIYRRTLPPEVSIHAYRLATKYNLPCEVYDASTIYVSFKNEYADRDQKLTGLNQIIVENYETFLGKEQLKMVIPGEPELLQKIQKQLKDELGKRAVIFTSKPYFLEILPPNSGKGEALRFLIDHIAVAQENILAFGDSMNDESMLTYAAHSVAMKNALPYIQTLAKHITEKTNDDDGVAHFISEHVSLV